MTLWFLSAGSMQDRCKEPATRHAPFGRWAIYRVMVRATLANPAPFSAAPVCWLAQSPSTAAMNKTLAKFTDFMARHSTSPRVIAQPARDGSDGA
jgi:hypothetical protein